MRFIHLVLRPVRFCGFVCNWLARLFLKFTIMIVPKSEAYILPGIMKLYVRSFTSSNVEKRIRRIAKRNQVMIISRCKWDLGFLNCALVNHIVALMVYCLFKGYIPKIGINEDKDESVWRWEWLFTQPSSRLICDSPQTKHVSCNRAIAPYRASLKDVYSKGRLYRGWSTLYRALLVLSPEAQSYHSHDRYNASFSAGPTIGILLRGTDYLKMKPSGHPIPPSPEDVGRVVVGLLRETNYQNIYVATEDKSLLDRFSAFVPNDKIRTNERLYFDDLYYRTVDNDGVSAVSFKIENENYARSIQYFSSLLFLIEADEFVGANCFGGMFVSFMRHEHSYLFNLGFYE